MKNDIGWDSTSRRFSTGQSLPEWSGRRGKGKLIGSPAPLRDSVSVTVEVALSIFALVMFCGFNGFMALMWLFALGPFSLMVCGIVSEMGGVIWQRVVMGAYVVLLSLMIISIAVSS